MVIINFHAKFHGSLSDLKIKKTPYLKDISLLFPLQEGSQPFRIKKERAKVTSSKTEKDDKMPSFLGPITSTVTYCLFFTRSHPPC